MFYCHGFVSCFDSGNPKIERLKELGPVAGCNIDYTKTANEVVTEVMKLVEEPCERPDDFDLDLYIRSGAMGDS
jgi:pimeloyl-CoA synthetase